MRHCLSKSMFFFDFVCYSAVRLILDFQMNLSQNELYEKWGINFAVLQDMFFFKNQAF